MRNDKWKFGRVCAALFFLIAALVSPAKSDEPAAEKQLPWLSATEQEIVDETGARVLLRGANHMGLLAWTDAETWVKSGEAERHFAHMSELGFNVVRIPINWSNLEPEKGIRDDSRLVLLDEIVRLCGKHGIYVIPEMHQWYWCKRFGGDGFPEWTCAKWEAKHWKEDLKPVLAAAADFWDDEELKQHFVDTWLRMVERYKDSPTVAGFDLFNEPHPGWGVIKLRDFESKTLTTFYRRLIDAIRRIDGRHILFVEPTPFQGTNVPNSKFHLESQLRALKRKNVVYAPHMYTGGAWNGELARIDVNAVDLQRDIESMLRTARDLSVPLWIGEHGVSSTAAGSAEWARAVVDQLDANALGAAWWAYWADDTFGLLSPDKSEKKNVVDLVARPYPRRGFGKIGAFSFDPWTREFQASITRTSEEAFWIELAVPARHYGNGFSLSIRTVPTGTETSLGRFEANSPTARSVAELADCAWSGAAGACGILKVTLAPSSGRECALTLAPAGPAEEDK